MAVRTFRNIDAEVRFLGLKLEDWAILVAVAGLCMGLEAGVIITVFLAGSLWAWMFLIKAHRPPGFSMAWLRYHAAPRVLGVGLEFAHAKFA